MALGRHASRRRHRPHFARRQSQHARRGQHHPRTFFQLGAQHRRRPACRLAHLVHDRPPHPCDRLRRSSLNPLRLPSQQTLPFPPPLPRHSLAFSYNPTHNVSFRPESSRFLRASSARGLRNLSSIHPFNEDLLRIFIHPLQERLVPKLAVQRL